MLAPVKHAFRVLRKDPVFTVVAICSLAIGIGATSAMFSFGDALLLRPLPVPEPNGIIDVATAGSSAFGSNTNLSYPDYVDLRDRNRTFGGLVGFSLSAFGFSPDAATLPRTKFGCFVSGNLFRVLGVQPAIGRGFRDDEDKVPGRDPVVVLGHDFWVSQFGANPAILGSKIRLNGIDLTVIGVAPERFTGVDQFFRPTLFVPFAMSARLNQTDNLNKRDVRWIAVKGRLKPGVTIAQSQADIDAIVAQLQRMFPDTNRNQRLEVQTELHFRIAQSPPNAALVAMMGLLALCVLAVACANVAGLLLSRAHGRSREIAVRLAIGAGRGALIRQLLMENLLLAIAGGGAGIAVAYAGARFLGSIPIPTDVPVVFDVSVDQRVLLFTLTISVLSTFLFGLTPALRMTRPDLVRSLKARDADNEGGRRLWGRNLIVAGQVALSLVLLIVSAVLLQGFQDELVQGPGFRTDHLYLTSVDTQVAHYSDAQTQLFFKNLLEHTRNAPGVKSATLTSVVPMIGGDSVPILPEGYQLPRGDANIPVFDSYVAEDFFSTMGIRLLKGRPILQTDRQDAPLVAVVNEHFATHFWPQSDALGKRFRLRNASGPLVQIVGISKMSKYFWIAEPPLDYVYLPYRQHPRAGLTLVVESSAPDAATLAPVVRNVVRGLDTNMPVFDTRTMDDLYTQRAVKTPRLIAHAVAGLGVMGLLLAIVGLYGLVAYSVSRRSREIGIRMAIGSERSGVILMVLRQGFTLGLAGVVVGLVLGIFVCRLLTSALWVATFNHVNVLLFPAIALPLLVITVLAAWQPAWRASRIDPMRALREE